MTEKTFKEFREILKKDLKTNSINGKNLERGGPNVEEERSRLKFKKNYAKLTND